MCTLKEAYVISHYYASCNIRFGERMSNVKKDNENRSTRILENRNSSTANGLVTSSNKIVSRKHILANRPSGGGRSNDLHRYSHTHGYGSNKPSSSSSASSNSTLSHQPLNGCHPMLDRSKHKKPINSEIMKRSLRYDFNKRSEAEGRAEQRIYF